MNSTQTGTAARRPLHRMVGAFLGVATWLGLHYKPCHKKWETPYGDLLVVDGRTHQRMEGHSCGKLRWHFGECVCWWCKRSPNAAGERQPLPPTQKGVDSIP